jgi:DNA-directed RNA polymerase alpha subunit
VDCAYCGAVQCNDCKVSFNKESNFEDYVKKDSSIQIEVYVVWKRGYKEDNKPEDLYVDWMKA